MTDPSAYPFDPTYGYSQAQLRAITPPPAVPGFAEFWQQTHAEAMTIPLQLEQTEVECPWPTHRMWMVRFTGLGGYRHGAWLLVPRGPLRRGMVVGHGYGGREAPDQPAVDVAAIFPCAPGFHLSARADLPNGSDRHVVYGIEQRDTYLIRFCVAGLWAAATALLDVCPSLAGQVDYHGCSFGGGLGALAVPWEPRFTRCVFDVPTFGHHALRLRCPCHGSGEAVRRWHALYPNVLEVLAFYDAAVAATFIRIPCLVIPARCDPAVPPPGQFAVANAVPNAQIFERAYGHHAWLGEEAEWVAINTAIQQFFVPV